MSLLVVGTVPIRGGEVLAGPVSLTEERAVRVGDALLPDCQGTAAMLAAAAAVCEHLGAPAPQALLGGDIGRGDGTRAVARALSDTVGRLKPEVVAFHYLQPILSLMLEAVETLSGRLEAARVHLVADAGGMYAAKAAGVASRFELMTPDAGEIGFLADPEASHPAYVTRFLLGADGFDPAMLARKASKNGGSARVLLVKGRVDHIVAEGRLVASVSEPDVPALEAIGGTGDTITGTAAAYLAAGRPAVDAAILAARANREAGQAMRARPDQTARDLVACLPDVLG